MEIELTRRDIILALLFLLIGGGAIFLYEKATTPNDAVIIKGKMYPKVVYDNTYLKTERAVSAYHPIIYFVAGQEGQSLKFYYPIQLPLVGAYIEDSKGKRIDYFSIDLAEVEFYGTPMYQVAVTYNNAPPGRYELVGWLKFAEGEGKKITYPLVTIDVYASM